MATTAAGGGDGAGASGLFGGDENCGSASSFASMTQAFSQRIAELQQLVCFRVEDSVKHIFVRDIQGIEASVRALEQVFEDLRAHTQQEMAALPKAQALLQAAKMQQQHLQQISSNLPQHLPGAQQQPQQQVQGGGGVAGVKVAAGGSGRAGAENTSKAAAAAPGADGGRRRGAASSAASSAAAAAAGPPRWLVTAAELASVPSYMRGRLTLDKVNAALEELAGHAAACHRAMLLVARNQLGRVAAEERLRWHELYHTVETKEGCRGRFWFMESDLRSGSAIKLDKSGKSLLMLLRHLGRLAEVRAVLEGGSASAYVLQAPP